MMKQLMTSVKKFQFTSPVKGELNDANSYSDTTYISTDNIDCTDAEPFASLPTLEIIITFQWNHKRKYSLNAPTTTMSDYNRRWSYSRRKRHRTRTTTPEYFLGENFFQHGFLMVLYYNQVTCVLLLCWHLAETDLQDRGKLVHCGIICLPQQLLPFCLNIKESCSK